MALLSVRGQLKYDFAAGPEFCRFLPLRASAGWGPLSGTRFEVRVYVDPTVHRGWVGDINLDEIDKFTNPSTTGLFAELRTEIADDLAAAIASAFESADARKATHDFAEETLSALRVVHRTFIAFVRHDRMQFWLRPDEDHRMLDAVDQRLGWYDARWEMPDGLWKVLHPQCPRCQAVHMIMLQGETGMTRELWAAFEDALRRGSYRAKPHRRLLANAFAQLGRNEVRAAIVEGVAAWELALASLAPTRLAERHVGLDDRKWKALVEKAGLRAGTDLLIALAPDLFGQSAEENPQGHRASQLSHSRGRRQAGPSRHRAPPVRDTLDDLQV